MKFADVIVVGLGAMGSAATFQLARRGADVLAIDQFSPPHDLGSSHGETRITRQAIGEGEAYVPFVLRSHEIWREIEEELGETLLVTCGALVLGSADDTAIHHGKPSFLGSTFTAARRFGIPHEDLSADEIRARFPQFNVTGTERGYYEPGGGFLRPERCVAAQIELAKRSGARIQVNERVLDIRSTPGSVQVATDRDVYEAGRVVLAAGAWMPGLAREPLASVKIHRQVLFWFEATRPETYRPERCPVFIWMHGDLAEEYFYGFPSLDGGTSLKVASERYSAALTRPSLVDRTVTEAEAAAMFSEHVRGRLNDVGPNCLRKATCLYTVTPDGDFVIDAHPDDERITLVSACSGHGFKHSAAIGERVARHLTGDGEVVGVATFAVGRLAERDRAAVPPAHAGRTSVDADTS